MSLKRLRKFEKDIAMLLFWSTVPDGLMYLQYEVPTSPGYVSGLVNGQIHPAQSRLY